MSKGFYSAGCPHPGVECFAQQVNKIQTHYGCKSNMGLKMSVSLELLIVELGVSAEPLQESIKRYKSWVIWTWLVSVWEKCDIFDVLINFNENFLKLPREQDQWIMQMFVAAGFNKEELVRLNRVRLHQQVLFLSCVLGASGKTLDVKYMTSRKAEEKWSKLTFPKEKAPRTDFHLWRLALRQIVPVGGIPDRLGRLTHSGYKIWDWRWDQERSRLLHYKGSTMDIYEHSNLPRVVNTPNRWTRTRIGQVSEKCGLVCTVRGAGLAVVAVALSAEPPREQVMPTRIKEVLKEWGCMWMWNSLRIVGDESWIKRAIERGTLVSVTNDSYIREMYPQVCSAAFILECSEGTGRIIGCFSETSTHANAYRGELMGLMAIHFILKAADRVWPGLNGQAVICSDCLGALKKVVNLPPHKIPTRCRHSDIKKKHACQLHKLVIYTGLLPCESASG